jgi:hypothetical protein
MNKNKKLSIFSTILAIILSDLMSANVAIVYCNRQKYGDSTASIAFLVALRYIILILAALINSYILWKRPEKSKQKDIL